MSYSHMGNPTLPSALSGFTSEFEMGSGGTRSLLSPENWSEPRFFKFYKENAIPYTSLVQNSVVVKVVVIHFHRSLNK